MPKLWLNSKVIKPGPNKTHKMKYYIYHEDGDDVTISNDPERDFANIQKNRNGVCFAGLIDELKYDDHRGKTKCINRIMYYIQDKNYTDKLDDQEKTDWITIAKHNSILPNYVTNEMVLSGQPVIKLVNISPSLLYIYLSALRVIQENQSFVRAMLYLVAVYRMNFSAAWAIASKLVITNSWHNIIQLGQNYGYKINDDVNDIKVPLNLIIGLNRYLKNPTTYDKRSLTDKNAYPYNVHNTIKSLCSINKEVSAGDVLQEPIVKAINSDTDTEAKKYLKEYKPA